MAEDKIVSRPLDEAGQATWERVFRPDKACPYCGGNDKDAPCAYPSERDTMRSSFEIQNELNAVKARMVKEAHTSMLMKEYYDLVAELEQVQDKEAK
jgi:hypothetical protein